jgi:hypothetical protein
MALAFVGPANAQETAYESSSTLPSTIRYQFSYSPIYQFETDMDVGGSFDVQRHFLRFDMTRIINPQWAIGLSLGFDFERWNFSGIEALAGIDPWNEIVRPSISVPMVYNTANNWRLMLIPTLEFAGATGAEASESLSYGAVLAAMRAFGPNLMLGLGAGVFNRLDEWEGFPFIAVNWAINDQFRLSNPFEAGVAGPAGLELIYTPSSQWEIGIGGAYRSYRFRLDDTSAVEDGIGQVDFLATFLRIGINTGKRISFDLNAGALFEGEISIDDKNGNKLGDTDTDTAPFVGVTLRGSF